MNIYVDDLPLSLGKGVSVVLNTCNSLLHTNEPFTFSFEVPLDDNNRQIFGIPYRGWFSPRPLYARLSGILQEDILGEVVIVKYTMDTISLRFQSRSASIHRFFIEKPTLGDWNLGTYLGDHGVVRFPYEDPPIFADGVWYNHRCFPGYDSPYSQKWGDKDVDRGAFGSLGGYNNWLPCPKVIDVLGKLFEQVGAKFDRPTVGPILDKLILIGVQNNSISESLAPLKISDLLNSVEYLTGCRFIVSSGSVPVIRLLASSSFLQRVQEIDPSHIFSYERQINESENLPDYAKRTRIAFSKAELQVSDESLSSVANGDILSVRNWIQEFYDPSQKEAVHALLNQKFYHQGIPWLLEWLGDIPLIPNQDPFSVCLCALRPNKRFTPDGESVDLPLRFASVEHSFVMKYMRYFNSSSPRLRRVEEKETAITIPFFYIDRQGIEKKEKPEFVYDRLKKESPSGFEIFLGMTTTQEQIVDKNGASFFIYPYGYDEVECQLMRVGNLPTPAPPRLKELLDGNVETSLISSFDFSEYITMDLLREEIKENHYLYSLFGEELMLDSVEVDSSNRMWVKAHFYPKKKLTALRERLKPSDFQLKRPV